MAVAALLVVVALTLLVTGLVQSSATLQWASFAASALAALLLALGELLRRRSPSVRAPGEDHPYATDRPLRGLDQEQPPAVEQPRRVSPPPVPPSSPRIPRVGGAHSSPDVRLPLADPSWQGPPPVQDPAPEPPPPPGDPGNPPVGLPQRSPSTGSLPVTRPGEPPAEEVEFTDLLMIMDLAEEVLVIDERPRYHVERCPYLAGETFIPISLAQARQDGFTPCGVCTPGRVLAERERDRRS